MRIWVSAIILILLSPCDYALAASKYALVEQRGLLNIENFTQWLTLGYRYAGTHSDSSDTTRHKFKEVYSLSTNGSIVDQRKLQFSLRTDVEANQEHFKTSSDSYSDSQNRDDLKLSYRFSALAFEREIYPIMFSSYLEDTYVSDSYRPSYNLTVSGNHLTSWYYHDIVPLRFDVSRTVSSTDGLENDTTTTTDYFSLNARNSIGNRSHTEFNASHQDQDREGGASEGETKSNFLSLVNNLALDKQRRYTLTSSISGSKTKQEGNPTTDIRWAEELDAQFGKALDGRATYEFKKQDNWDFDGNTQELISHTVTGQLHHRLYQSLETTLDGHYRDSEYLGGDENEVGGLLRFDYRKKLPQTSMLYADLAGGTTLTKRNLDETQIDVQDERHANVQQGEMVQLRVSGTLTNVLGVKSFDPDILYVPGLDYIVNYEAGTIEILFGGGILDGTDIYVDYSVLIDSDIEYRTDIYALGSTLDMLDGKFKIRGRYSVRDQQITSGESTSGNWGKTTTMLLRGEAKYPYQRYVLEYYDYDNPLSKYHYFEGAWYFNRSFVRSTVNAQVKNRYTIYDAVSENSDGYYVNNFTVGVGYQRAVSTWGSFDVSADYLDTSGDYISRQWVSVRSHFQANINKLILSATATTNYRVNESWTSREDTFSITLTRYF